MKKIYWLSDSPFLPTGFANQAFNIMNILATNGFDCHYQAHNYVGYSLPPGVKLEDGTTFNFWVHGNGKMQYSQDVLVPKIRELRADFFGILLDTFMVYPWLLNLDLAPARSFFYFPSDGGGGLPLACENILRKMTFNVAMSRFAQKQAKELYGIETFYIPHATDTNIFFPSDKEKAKEKYRLKDKFVVGVVARNQGRKMLDRTIKAFSVFCKDKPDAMLFLHTDPSDAAAIFDMNVLINRYKVNNRVLYSGMTFYKGIPYKEMNDIYNAMDVFFLSTSGEGFGIPIIEAMAAGVPCAVTDYTTTQELLVENGQCGEPIKVCAEVTGSWTVERAVMDVNDAVEKLNKLYFDKELREQYRRAGRKKVEDIYSWSVVGKQWLELFKRMSQ